MPAQGIQLSPKSHIMTYDEIYTVAKKFVDLGVTKIRITGGEPLVRKDVEIVLKKLATLPVELSITTNGVLIDKYIAIFKECNLQKINISIDSLNPTKFNSITRRKDFEKVMNNIQLFTNDPFFKVKLNCVLMKETNDDEIIDFIEYTRYNNLNLRFIEFMPFDGNKWNLDKLVSLETITQMATNHFGNDHIIKLQDAPNDTSKNYQIKGATGSFAVISTVTNPFCDSCNRIRLTANGMLKNCLFSGGETNLLETLRAGGSIEKPINIAVQSKKKVRGGMDTQDKFTSDNLRLNNRSMIAIGG
ncbi:cyclic pyranopterin phosphate synthase [Wenyingzhuangia heitensis]|uniref:Cyclic pyranopterin phosphate synthase n=2 Tax=Wenyingzhuangia heitensis TaxID=1487859 RepID=A0ABX0U8V8_9FLAO|nr:cyclic pyranopterin phosphate synthase [Wenyingzhuangia heitensis]